MGSTVVIRNRTKETMVAGRVSVADDSLTRLIGLLNRSSLDPNEGLWIFPSSAIHTLGMRFVIDAVFLEKMRGRLCRVKKIYHRLPPWRMTRFVWGSESVLELPAGAAQAGRIEVGDELEIQG